MNIRVSILLTLAIISLFALLMACGSDAPASESVDIAPAPQAADTASEAVAEDAVEVGYDVGLRAPEFSMSLLDGSEVTSASLAMEGKPAFLYFHATF